MYSLRSVDWRTLITIILIRSFSITAGPKNSQFSYARGVGPTPAWGSLPHRLSARDHAHNPLIPHVHNPGLRVQSCHLFEPLRLDPKRPPKMSPGEAFERLRAIIGILLGLS